MNEPIRVEFVLEGRFALDGGAMFGIIPKPLWQLTNAADASNRIELAARCLLIRHPEAGNILVDAGIGQKWDAKGQKIYNIRHEDDLGGGDALGLEASLEAAGVGLAQIDHVLLTHLHFDHAGGATRWGEDGEVVPTFAGRPHHLLREQWSWAHNPSERDKGSYRSEDFAIFEESPDAAPLHLYDGICEIFPGVTLIPRRGHTPGMACVKIDAHDGTWLFLADLVPTLGHLKIPYVMGYDLNPAVTCQEKREILSEAARHGWKLAFVHDPHTPWCQVEADGRGQWRAVPRDGSEE